MDEIKTELDVNSIPLDSKADSQTLLPDEPWTYKKTQGLFMNRSTTGFSCWLNKLFFSFSLCVTLIFISSVCLAEGPKHLAFPNQSHYVCPWQSVQTYWVYEMIGVLGIIIGVYYCYNLWGVQSTCIPRYIPHPDDGFEYVASNFHVRLLIFFIICSTIGLVIGSTCLVSVSHSNISSPALDCSRMGFNGSIALTIIMSLAFLWFCLLVPLGKPFVFGLPKATKKPFVIGIYTTHLESTKFECSLFSDVQISVEEIEGNAAFSIFSKFAEHKISHKAVVLWFACHKKQVEAILDSFTSLERYFVSMIVINACGSKLAKLTLTTESNCPMITFKDITTSVDDRDSFLGSFKLFCILMLVTPIPSYHWNLIDVLTRFPKAYEEVKKLKKANRSTIGDDEELDQVKDTQEIFERKIYERDVVFFGHGKYDKYEEVNELTSITFSKKEVVFSRESFSQDLLLLANCMVFPPEFQSFVSLYCKIVEEKALNEIDLNYRFFFSTVISSFIDTGVLDYEFIKQ